MSASQRLALRKHGAALALRDAAFERILASPLPRTRQTAEIVNQFHAAPIQEHPGLADIRSGFNGKPVADYFSAIAADPLHARINGGESNRGTRPCKFLRLS